MTNFTRINETKILYVPMIDFTYRHYTNFWKRPGLGTFEDNEIFQKGLYKNLIVVYMEARMGKGPPEPVCVLTGNYTVFLGVERLSNYPGVEKGFLILRIRRTLLSLIHRWKIRRGVKKMIKIYEERPLPFPMCHAFDPDGPTEDIYTIQKRKDSIKNATAEKKESMCH